MGELEAFRLDALEMGNHILLLLQLLSCFRGSSCSRLLDFVARGERATAFAFDGRRPNALEVGFKNRIVG